MANCAHDHLELAVATYRFEDSPARCVKLEGRCMSCGAPVRFIGLDVPEPDQASDVVPAMTRSGETARIPFAIGATQ